MTTDSSGPGAPAGCGRRRVGFVHASPAAIPPLMQFYSEEAPDLEITNLLDDGLLRLFAAGDLAAAGQRLAEMLATARLVYAAEVAILTCSAVPRPVLESLRAGAGLPVLKIDEPMARRAVLVGRRIGVAVTFPPTAELTRQLLLDVAAELERQIDVCIELVPEAYQALLAGYTDMHDRLLLAAVGALARQRSDVIALAQVSMARVLAQARAAVSVPVLSSLDTSLDAVRHLLARPA